MITTIKRVWPAVLLLIVVSCGPETDPAPALPTYLQVPTSLEGYAGSGLVTISGGTVTLKAEGPERLDTDRNTYQGVTGRVGRENVDVFFTLGQPRPYNQNWGVPADYQANGNLSIEQTLSPGTYPMGFNATPGPRGEITDLTLNLTGGQTYVADSGKLTLSEITRIRSEGTLNLYRVQGTFETVMYALGPGITDKSPTLGGTFDCLLVQ